MRKCARDMNSFAQQLSLELRPKEDEGLSILGYLQHLEKVTALRFCRFHLLSSSIPEMRKYSDGCGFFFFFKRNLAKCLIFSESVSSSIKLDKESTCNPGDLGLIPGLGKIP